LFLYQNTEFIFNLSKLCHIHRLKTNSKWFCIGVIRRSHILMKELKFEVIWLWAFFKNHGLHRSYKKQFIYWWKIEIQELYDWAFFKKTYLINNFKRKEVQGTSRITLSSYDWWANHFSKWNFVKIPSNDLLSIKVKRLKIVFYAEASLKYLRCVSPFAHHEFRTADDLHSPPFRIAPCVVLPTHFQSRHFSCYPYVLARCSFHAIQNPII